MHSNYSDGRNTTAELVRSIKGVNIKVLVLTDHDRVDGLEEFEIQCVKAGIECIPGIEISSTDTTSSRPKTIDILGYGFNPKILLDNYHGILQHNLKARIKYIKKVLDTYKKRKVMNFTVEKLTTLFNLPVAAANKYWLIAARMRSFPSFIEAPKALEIARKQLKRGGDYFVERENYVSTKEAINAIKQSGGIAIWAHPTKTMEKLEKKYENSENIFSIILDRMVHEGLDGLEVHTPHGDSYRKMLLDYSEKYGLIVTGGSDYHGEFGLIKDDYLGKGGISYEEFLQIKEAIFL